MDLMTMYKNNKAFKDYVNKYSVCNNKTVEESIKDNVVINYAIHIANPKEKEDWILGK